MTLLYMAILEYFGGRLDRVLTVETFDAVSFDMLGVLLMLHLMNWVHGISQVL